MRNARPFAHNSLVGFRFLHTYDELAIKVVTRLGHWNTFPRQFSSTNFSLMCGFELWYTVKEYFKTEIHILWLQWCGTFLQTGNDFWFPTAKGWWALWLVVCWIYHNSVTPKTIYPEASEELIVTHKLYILTKWKVDEMASHCGIETSVPKAADPTPRYGYNNRLETDLKLTSMPSFLTTWRHLQGRTKCRRFH